MKPHSNPIPNRPFKGSSDGREPVLPWRLGDPDGILRRPRATWQKFQGAREVKPGREPAKLLGGKPLENLWKICFENLWKIMGPSF